MGTYQTRFDAKGRVSIPAPFRAVLRAGAESMTALVLRRSSKHRCIEGWPAPVFQALTARVDLLDLFSADEDDLTTALYAATWGVEPDKEGRIIVPDSLVQHAALTDSVAFMGKGQIFQIWEPGAASDRLSAAYEGVNARALTLPAARP